MADFDTHKPIEQFLRCDSMMLDLPIPPERGDTRLTFDIEHAEAGVRWRQSIDLTDAQVLELRNLVNHAIQQRKLDG